MLFVELGLIRWGGAYNVYLSFFTNFVLLASFLGIGVGFLRAKRGRDLFGFAPAALAAFVAFPLLRVARPAWRAGLADNTVDLVAHVIYGVVTAIVVGDLAQPHDHRRTSDRERESARVA